MSILIKLRPRRLEIIRCNKYCEMENRASKRSQSFTDVLYKYMKDSGIYEEFKPRPHCVSTVLVSSKDHFEERFQILTTQNL